MNLDEILASASLYDLFRLQTSIRHELYNPERLDRIKNSLIVGQPIEYFNSKYNNIMSATVVEKYREALLVEHVSDRSRWEIKYYSINLNDNTLQFNRATHKLNRNNVAIGDLVGFKHNGQQIAGNVIKLNPKTVKLITNNKHTWTVYYESLYPITDAIDTSNMNLIDL